MLKSTFSRLMLCGFLMAVFTLPALAQSNVSGCPTNAPKTGSLRSSFKCDAGGTYNQCVAGPGELSSPIGPSHPGDTAGGKMFWPECGFCCLVICVATSPPREGRGLG